MSAEQYRAAHRRIYEMINAGNFDKAEELIAPNAVDHTSRAGVGLVEGLRKFVDTFHSAFPDLRFTVEQTVVEGDTLMARDTMTGTHKGEFMGTPPTGKSINVSGVDIVRFGADGRVVEHWGFQDELAMMQQLGIIQPPGA